MTLPAARSSTAPAGTTRTIRSRRRKKLGTGSKKSRSGLNRRLRGKNWSRKVTQTDEVGIQERVEGLVRDILKGNWQPSAAGAD